MYYIDHNNSYLPARQINYIADNPDDVTKLPTSITKGEPQPNDSTAHLEVSYGSQCLVISTGELYILNSQDEWVSV